MQCSLWSCKYPEDYIFKFPTNIANKNVYVNYNTQAASLIWNGDVQFRGEFNEYSPVIRFKMNVTGVNDNLSWHDVNYALLKVPCTKNDGLIEYRIYTYLVDWHNIKKVRNGIYETVLTLDVLAFEQEKIANMTVLVDRYETQKASYEGYRLMNGSTVQDELETTLSAPSIDIVYATNILPSDVLSDTEAGGFYLLTTAQSGYHEPV